MHDDRVPNVSRCTQLAAFGRSSPSGLRWSARTRRKASATSSPSAGVAERLPHEVDLAARARRGPGSPARGSPVAGPPQPSPGAGEVDEEEGPAVPDEQPRAVVVGRPVTRQERVDRVGRRGVAGEREGQFAPGPLRRVLGLAQRLVGQPGAHAVLVDGQPCAPGELVPPTQNPGRALVEHGHRGRRPLQDLVAVGPDDQRLVGHDPRRDDQEAHSGHPTERSGGADRARVSGCTPRGTDREATVRACERARHHGRRLRPRGARPCARRCRPRPSRSRRPTSRR